MSPNELERAGFDNVVGAIGAAILLGFIALMVWAWGVPTVLCGLLGGLSVKALVKLRPGGTRDPLQWWAKFADMLLYGYMAVWVLNEFVGR